MKVQRWMAIGAVALLTLSGGKAALAQTANGTMTVLLEFNDNREPWEYAPQMSRATGMQLVGISPSTRAAVFTVPNETDLARGTVAARNQQTIFRQFPGVVKSYNFGASLVTPADLQQVRPVSAVAPTTDGVMTVVIEFNDNREPWDYVPQISTSTRMQLVGVSPSTRAAVFTVPNETNLSLGTVAARNQQTIYRQFPGVVKSYNFGARMVTPTDLQQTRPVMANDTRRGLGRGRRAQIRFTEQDRQAVRDWYSQNRTVGNQVRVGAVLDQNLLTQGFEAPYDLRRRLPAVSSNSRYFILGGNVVLLDGSNYVIDMIPLN